MQKLSKRKFHKAIEERKALECKYTSYALTFGASSGLKKLPQGRICSVSPAAYYHVTGCNAKGYDNSSLKELNGILHSQGVRAKVEENIKSYFLSKSNDSFMPYTYVLKDRFFIRDFDECNKSLKYWGWKALSKQKHKELMNLFARFEELSKSDHHSLNGVHKRIYRKQELERVLAEHKAKYEN